MHSVSRDDKSPDRKRGARIVVAQKLTAQTYAHLRLEGGNSPNLPPTDRGAV